MKDHVIESNGSKFMVFNTGWGYEIKEIKPSLFNTNYIINSIRFIVWTMVWFSALALVVISYVCSK